MQALHIPVTRIMDLNAEPASKTNGILVSFTVAPPQLAAEQSIDMLSQQITLQVNNANSGLRSQGEEGTNENRSHYTIIWHTIEYTASRWCVAPCHSDYSPIYFYRRTLA